MINPVGAGRLNLEEKMSEIKVKGKLIYYGEYYYGDEVEISFPPVQLDKIKEGDEVLVKVRITQCMLTDIDLHNVESWLIGVKDVVYHIPAQETCACPHPDYPGAMIACDRLTPEPICATCHKPLPQPKEECKHEWLNCNCKKCGIAFLDYSNKPPAGKIELLQPTGLTIHEAIYRLESKINELIDKVNGGLK